MSLVKHPLRVAAIIALSIAALGLIAQRLAGPSALPRGLTIFRYLFVHHEGVFLWLLGAFAAVTWWLTMREPADAEQSAPPFDLPGGVRPAVVAWMIAALVFVITTVGHFVVMHATGLSMDEHALEFQARLLLAGQLAAPVPEMWQPLGSWFTPIFVNFHPIEGRWVAAYFPGAAAIRALFALGGVPFLTNPVLAAASVLLVYACARRLWPAHPRRALVAAVLFAASSQVIIMSMTGYSMPAYLAVNLLWLYLYLRAGTAAWLLLPFVGVLALGLHNPFPHALFVAPFLVRALWERRWRWTAYWAVVYAAGSALWLGWLRFSAGTPVPGAPPSPGLLHHFALPTAQALLTQLMSLALLFTWQTPVAGLLLVVALMAWRSLERVERDLAIGLLLTFGFYFLYPIDQGHGWGYRYVYGTLGNLALLAALGAALLARRPLPLGARGLANLVAASLVATVLLQWPLRAIQSERFVAPFARALDFIESVDAPLVAVDLTAGWYAQDLVRNDPLFERRPVVFFWVPGRGPHPSLLPDIYRDSVRTISRAEMARFGMITLPQRRAAPADTTGR